MTARSWDVFSGFERRGLDAEKGGLMRPVDDDEAERKEVGAIIDGTPRRSRPHRDRARAPACRWAGFDHPSSFSGATTAEDSIGEQRNALISKPITELWTNQTMWSRHWIPASGSVGLRQSSSESFSSGRALSSRTRSSTVGASTPLFLARRLSAPTRRSLPHPDLWGRSVDAEALALDQAMLGQPRQRPGERRLADL
jgi:hypothetical protein